MRPPPRRQAPIDCLLLGATLTLLVLGVVMVYSASVIWAEQNLGRPLYFFHRQILWAAISLAGMAAAARTDYNRLREWLFPIFVVTCLLLAAALFGPKIAGVRRWIRLGPIGLQPAEFAKLSSILFLASYLDRKHSKLASPVHGLIIPLGVVGVLLVLIGLEPDLGTPMLMFTVAGLLLFVAGAKVQWILAAGLAASPIVCYELLKYPYRRARVLSFLAPFENIRGVGYQLSQSLLAVGSGGWAGKGFGASQLKLMYLPTPHTDFIFPVVCEELGLIGALAILGLFATLLVRGVRAARRAPNLFGSLLACGVTFTICLQAFFNMAMSLGLLPTKGIPLPFFSFGGSSLLSTLIGVGILLNISRQGLAEPLH
ncbi:MAG: cell division protein FtsW [Elusimicrobia bacterium GWC2_65_9]|nr:MAG: cell division protein FtsW [Elusimicrobia bacterium GWA2_66_18]OGR74772.1 MAG: cell division protein FtsW [Elusimicrobia bacterium GWC2_65_9]